MNCASTQGSKTIWLPTKNRQDGTVEATITGPGLTGTTQNFVRVAQGGAAVELTLFIFGGSYKGTIRARGAQMTGIWTQNPGAPPLPLNMDRR